VPQHQEPLSAARNTCAIPRRHAHPNLLVWWIPKKVQPAPAVECCKRGVLGAVDRLPMASTAVTPPTPASLSGTTILRKPMRFLGMSLVWHPQRYPATRWTSQRSWQMAFWRKHLLNGYLLLHTSILNYPLDFSSRERRKQRSIAEDFRGGSGICVTASASHALWGPA
jgi:hypothetical protein